MSLLSALKRKNRSDDAPAPEAPAAPPKEKKPKAVAHFVPAGGVRRSKNGENVTALCGATITGEPKGDDLPICQACVIAQFERDDVTTSEKVLAEHKRGIDVGKASAEREVRQLAETQARQARVELEAPRFDDLGDSIRLRPVHGGVATVRKQAVGAIAVQPTEDGRHSVVVDGLVLHTVDDEDLARRHHEQLTAAVFPS